MTRRIVRSPPRTMAGRSDRWRVRRILPRTRKSSSRPCRDQALMLAGRENPFAPGSAGPDDPSRPEGRFVIVSRHESWWFPV
jgi:hypothetical protein